MRRDLNTFRLINFMNLISLKVTMDIGSGVFQLNPILY